MIFFFDSADDHDDEEGTTDEQTPAAVESTVDTPEKSSYPFVFLINGS